MMKATIETINMQISQLAHQKNMHLAQAEQHRLAERKCLDDANAAHGAVFALQNLRNKLEVIEKEADASLPVVADVHSEYLRSKEIGLEKDDLPQAEAEIDRDEYGLNDGPFPKGLPKSA